VPPVAASDEDARPMVTSKIVRLKITLDDVKPTVMRRI
jgi:hypothetical protein